MIYEKYIIEQKNSNIIIAKYRCCKCNYEYDGISGPQNPCPRCGSLYLKWINYEDLNKKYFHH
jgi:rRNA maturation endonuclease Nob1